MGDTVPCSFSPRKDFSPPRTMTAFCSFPPRGLPDDSGRMRRPGDFSIFARHLSFPCGQPRRVWHPDDSFFHGVVFVTSACPECR